MRKPNRYGLEVMETDDAPERVMAEMESMTFSLIAYKAKNGQARIAMSGELTNEQSSIVANAVLSCLEGFGIIAVPVGKEDVS